MQRKLILVKVGQIWHVLVVCGHWPLYLGNLRARQGRCTCARSASARYIVCTLDAHQVRLRTCRIHSTRTRCVSGGPRVRQMALCAYWMRHVRARWSRVRMRVLEWASGAPTAAKISFFWFLLADFSLQLVLNYLKTLYNFTKTFIMTCVTSNTFWSKFRFLILTQFA